MGNEGHSHLEDMAHERLVWKLQHVAWGLFALLIVAALAGAFGRGPLSRATAGERNSSFWAEYERFARYHGPSVLKVHLGASGASALPAVWLSREFVDQIQMEDIYPEPEQVKMAEDRLIYIFVMARTNEGAIITFNFKPEGYGKARARVGLVDGPELEFSQLVYP